MRSRARTKAGRIQRLPLAAGAQDEENAVQTAPRQRGRTTAAKRWVLTRTGKSGSTLAQKASERRKPGSRVRFMRPCLPQLTPAHQVIRISSKSDRLLAHVTGRAHLSQPCPCDHDRYELKDRHDRQLRTSVGTVVLRWRRLCCRVCCKVFVPLRAFLGLHCWQSKTGELERIVVEVMSEQSYRRDSAHLDTIDEILVPKSTAHRRVAQTAASQWNFPNPKPQALLADGTGFKRRPDPAAGLINRAKCAWWSA